MEADTLTLLARRELASRTSNDLEVTLWWDPRINAASVSVWDWKRDTHFEVAVHGDRALDVFNHPFAYASRRGLDNAMAGGL
jgi:hypothetical protein